MVEQEFPFPQSDLPPTQAHALDAAVDPSGSGDVLPPGTPVQVRTQFDHTWASGFEITEARRVGRASEPSYRVRRMADHQVLPAFFPASTLRRE